MRHLALHPCASGRIGMDTMYESVFMRPFLANIFQEQNMIRDPRVRYILGKRARTQRTR